MFQKVFKYTLLAIIMLNLPTVALFNLGSTYGSALSYLSFILLVTYYGLYLRSKPNFWLLSIGLAYFLIGGVQMYAGDERTLIMLIFKFLLFIICGSAFFYKVNSREMIVVLAIGASTVLINAIFFPTHLGRSSGFYMNPNGAGLISLMGFGLTYGLKGSKIKTAYQILFSLAGFLTFSRTFLVLWILINIISIRISKKNIRVLGVGLALFISLFIFGELFDIGGQRFDSYKAILFEESSTQDLSDDSRTQTWALFYDEVLGNPFIGGGFGKFQGQGVIGMGVHNTYLLLIGEAGIIPFGLMVIYGIYLLKSSFSVFNKKPEAFILSVVLLLYLTTTHDFFDYYERLAIMLFTNGLIVKAQRENIELSSTAVKKASKILR